jgi:hypothetical protein
MLEAKTLMRNVQEVKDAGIKVPITIGTYVDVYYAYRTNAPVDYDGFGTFEIKSFQYDDVRCVLIREEHLEWQWMRYRSGMRMLETIDYMNEVYITDALIRQMKGTTE